MSRGGVTVAGIGALRVALSELDRQVQKKVARQAVAAGGTVVNKTTKRAIPLAQFRDLRKSVGRRSRSYPARGTVVQVIGPRFDYQGAGGRRPSAYAWDVEFGTLTTPAHAFFRRGLREAREPALAAIRATFRTKTLAAVQAARAKGGRR